MKVVLAPIMSSTKCQLAEHDAGGLGESQEKPGKIAKWPPRFTATRRTKVIQSYGASYPKYHFVDVNGSRTRNLRRSRPAAAGPIQRSTG